MAVLKLRRVFVGFAIAVLALVGVPVAEASPATVDHPPPAGALVVTYDASQAGDGWPRTQTEGLGAGTVWMGRRAVNQGYDTTRIANHEWGHILGLPDQRTGKCDDLMSGHSALVECTNARPSSEEVDEVDHNFANGRVLPRQLFVDAAPVAAR